MKNWKLGVQLYSVRESYAKDLRATLKRVADIGYEGVEFFGGFSWSAEEVKQAALEAGVTVIGWHAPFDSFLPAQIHATAAYAKAVGMKHLVLPMLPDDLRKDAAGWRKGAAILHEASRVLKDYGIAAGYHNHYDEFALYEGDQNGWDLVMTNAPDITGQLDNGNALHGGGIALDYLKKYPGRARTIHLKPYSLADGFAAMIGEDSLDWQGTLAELDKQNVTEWCIVECSCPEKYEEFEGIRRCYQALKSLGF